MGWTDGNDAIAERLCAACEEGDVLLRCESPGGAFAGSFQSIDRALAAKAKHGRRITGLIDEQACSLGFLWMSMVCDEIFIVKYGQAGSIGARAGHVSVAGALAQQGVAVEFFVWPDEGKVALAPEKPLGEEGRRRGNRDVRIAGEAFAAAVSGSAIGMRRGLTVESIVAMKADVYTGQAAVDMGLADGVASLEEVTAYALRMAEGGGGDMPVNARGEDEPKDKPGEGRAESDEKPEERAGDDDPLKCAKCGEESPKDARYCAKCGERMADDDKPEGEDDDHHDDPPPTSRKPEGVAARASRVSPSVAASAGIAEIIGADPRSSLPAQKAHALDVRAVLDKCAKMTGQRNPAAILGALDAVERDAANAPRYRRERDAERAKATATQRRDLAMRLIACNVQGWERGNVFVDAKGEKFTDRILDMKIDTLRGMVEGFERARANRPDVDPFQPSREKSEAAEAANKPAATLLSGEPTDAQIAAAMQLPAVKNLVAQTGRDPKIVARAHLKAMAQNGAMAR